MNRRRLLDRQIVAAMSQPPGQRDAMREQKIRADIAALDSRLIGIDARLSREFPEYAQLAIPQPLTIAEAQKLLTVDEALVAFFVGDNAAYRFIVRTDRVSFQRIKVERVLLDAATKALRDGLDPERHPQPVGFAALDAASAHALYRTLLAGRGSAAERRHAPADRARRAISRPALLGAANQASPSDAGGVGGYRRVHWFARDYAITVLPR